MFFPYGQGAGLLVDAGAEPYKIDKALEKFGMSVLRAASGPFDLPSSHSSELHVVVLFVLSRHAYGSVPHGRPERRRRW
jgi:hypothetical protein